MLIVKNQVVIFPFGYLSVDGPGYQIPKHPVMLVGGHEIDSGGIDDQNRKIILL